MATNFPTSADDGTTLPEPTTGDVVPAAADTNRSQAIKAMQTKVGIGASTPTDATVLKGTAAGVSAWGQVEIDELSATGTPSSVTFLRGDGTWSSATGGGGGDFLADGTVPMTGDLNLSDNSMTNAAAVDFDTDAAAPTWQEGRVFYDPATKALTVYDDESEASLQVGQEQRVRVYNANGVTIANGAAVTVTGLTVDKIIEVGLAIASDKTSALNTIGVATHDIEAGTYGWVTTSGIINGIDTLAYTEGAAIYLSDTVAGAYTETRPLSPSYEVRMGGIAESNALTGKIYAELRIINNDQDNTSFLNGAILEPNRVDVVSNGTTVNLSLNSEAANSKLSLIFDQDYVSVADGINIDLTLGTDTVPVQNWVYITPAGTMTVSTSGFPTNAQFVPVARCVVPSAATAQTYGLYKVHAYTDHLQDSQGQGHLSHLNDWVRKRPAQWQDGVVLTQSVSEGTSAATIDLSYTSGTISQLHDHTFPVYDTAIKPAFVINDSTTAYDLANGITSAIDTDSLGVAIASNKYYNLVVWGVISEETKDCKLIFNLPSGSYTSVASALADTDNTADYTIPTEYLGTGFLITKLVVQRGASTVTVQTGGTTDLRGSIPAVGGGSVIGGGGITVFDSLTDTPASKVGASLQAVRVNVGETALEYYTPEAGGGGGNPFGATYVIGATGDYATLNAWNADTPANNDILFIDGDHSLTADMTISVTGVTIIGYKSSTITLGAFDITEIGAGTTIDGITFAKSGVGYVRSTLEGVTIRNCTMEVTDTGGNGFLMLGARATMSNVTISSATAAIGGAILVDGDYSMVSDICVDVVSGKAYNPMVKVSGDYCSVRGIVAESTTYVLNSELIEISGAQNSFTSGTIKSYFSSGLVVSGSNHIITGVTVVQLQPNSYAIEVEGASNTFTGMSVYAQSTGIRGFWIQQDKTVITGSSIRGFTSGDAVYLDGARDNTLVSGNLIWGWTNGVRVTASTQDYTAIVGNKIFDCTTDINDSGTNTFYQTATDSDPLNEIH